MKRGAEKLETNEPFWQRRSGGTNGEGGIRQQRPPRLQRVLLLRQNVGRKSTKPRSTFTHTRNTRRGEEGKNFCDISYTTSYLSHIIPLIADSVSVPVSVLYHHVTSAGMLRGNMLKRISWQMLALSIG